jgi:hypothetical protein
MTCSTIEQFGRLFTKFAWLNEGLLPANWNNYKVQEVVSSLLNDD